MPGSCVQVYCVQLFGGCGNTGEVFVAGHSVKGCLHLELVQHIALTSIRITIKGRAFVHWTEQALRGVGEPRYKDTHHHSAHEEYFDQTLVLLGQTKNDRPEKCYLPAGKYTYPFQYRLPAHLPCSFEGEYGYIRYWVRATIEKGREICHVTKLPFTVISPLDLNVVPDSNNPVQESAEKKMCCFCCLSGPISAMICLPKRGFVPGEPIKFGAEISNLSSRKIGQYSVELKMTTLFKTPTKCRSVTKQIGKVRRHSVGRGESDSWMDQLIVPSLPPSCLIGCNIISVKYTLELRVDPVGPAFDLTLPIEIVIGTLPHRPSPTREAHNYANVSIATSTSSGIHGDQTGSGRQSCNSPIHRQPIGVPVYPMQGGHLIVNPAHINPQPPNQNITQHPGPSSSPSATASERSQGHHHRPPSRQSSAPSTSSTMSLPHSTTSTIFMESPFSRIGIKWDDGHKSSTNGPYKFTPLYPVYFMRR